MLRVFSLFDHFTGDPDNFFFSEYMCFITALLATVHDKEMPSPFALKKLFFVLTHNCPHRINRYELLSFLGLLCCDIHTDDNVPLLWELLQTTSAVLNHVDSFATFSNGVVALVTLIAPSILEFVGKEPESFVTYLASALYDSCCRSQPHADSPRPLISQELFSQWAPSAFRMDETIRSGHAVYNSRVLALQTLLGLQAATLQDVDVALQCAEKGETLEDVRLD